MTQALNQDEIDSLLSKAPEGDDLNQQQKTIDPFIYDLANNDKSLYNRVSSLSLINERFAKLSKISTNNFLKRNVEITVLDLKICKFQEYVASLSIPTSISIVKITPLKGSSLFVIDPALGFTIVEYFFGGEGKSSPPTETRELTETENRITKLLIENFFEDLKIAWLTFLEIDFEYKRLETNPSMVNILNLSEFLIVSKFRIELEGGGGEFHLCLPYNMIEPISEILNAGMRGEKEVNDEKWGDKLREEILEAQVKACCTLTHKKISLKEVLHFKNGDILAIDIPEEVVLKVSDIPMFSAHFGTFEGKYAVKIVGNLKKTGKR